MKKLNLFLMLSLALSIITANAFGQTSKRYVLAEEFTNASCGPCASQNPAFNALLDANESKVIAIKYQTNWPGTDPMNAQTQTWAGPRVTYYGIDGVPNVRLDGDTTLVMGTSYTGAPANLNQSKIDQAAAIQSPYDIALTWNYSADYDSMYIQAIVTATGAVSGTLKLHTVLVENTISFTTPPGSNGETEFHDVMRKMIPSATGTTIANSWTVGQTQTFNFGTGIPTYIYDLNQLAVVVFIQNDANKKVHQAAYSGPKTLSLDAGIIRLTGINFTNCGTTVNPVITFKNMATTTITSATFTYKMDNTANLTYSWNGNLTQGAEVEIPMPLDTAATTGSHTYTVSISTINGTPDFNLGNNSKVKTFAVMSAPALSPVAESFQLAAFPPTGWLNEDAGGDTKKWTRKTAAGANGTTACAKIAFWNISDGQVDNLYVKPTDFSNLATASMSFYVAHQIYGSGYIDTLMVQVSTNCGATWTNVYHKFGSALATVANANTSTEFSPTSAQWRMESINLNAYAGQPNVIIRFSAHSGYGNDAYIDEINVGGTISSSGYTVSGAINYNNTALTAMNGVVVNLMNGTTQVATTTTNANGSYSFSNVSNGNYTIVATTTSPWAGISSTDVLKIKRHIAGLELLTEPIRLSAADVNNSASITSTDALKVQRRLAGLDATFTKPDWIFEKPTSGGVDIVVNGANVTQNFFGLCTGDVNGSNIPAIFIAPENNNNSTK